jgi:excisionase family DNA binding protein
MGDTIRVAHLVDNADHKDKTVNYSTEQAGDILHISTRMVRQHCKKGRITAEKVGRDYVIAPSDLEAFQRVRRSPEQGRPKKKG